LHAVNSLLPDHVERTSRLTFVERCRSVAGTDKAEVTVSLASAKVWQRVVLAAAIVGGGAPTLLGCDYSPPIGAKALRTDTAARARRAQPAQPAQPAHAPGSCGVNHGDCDANATCTPLGPGTNSCACNANYTGDGKTCDGVDACATANGGCAATAACTPTGPGTASCACNTGYSGDGTTCTPINACATANGGCDAHAS
jgi:hypothetical protein